MKKGTSVALATAAAFAFLAGGHGDVMRTGLVPAQAQESPGDVLAAQLRRQGFACDAPISARRDPELQAPDEAVWTLTCRNAVYRVHLTPDKAARVEVIH